MESEEKKALAVMQQMRALRKDKFGKRKEKKAEKKLEKECKRSEREKERKQEVMRMVGMNNKRETDMAKDAHRFSKKSLFITQ